MVRKHQLLKKAKPPMKCFLFKSQWHWREQNLPSLPYGMGRFFPPTISHSKCFLSYKLHVMPCSATIPKPLRYICFGWVNYVELAGGNLKVFLKFKKNVA